MIDTKNLKLSVASSPHVSSPAGTRNLMLDVLVALVPALIMAAYFFGPRALLLTAVSVAGCEFFEWAYRKALKKPGAAGDLSAAVTGVLLAFVCPVTLPYWTILVGDFFAIVIVKQLFGGLGQNFMNPALGGRAFLMMSYPVAMTTWVLPGTPNWAGIVSAADAVTGATPLSNDFMHSGVMPDGVSLMDMFVGNVGGCVGEISALMLLLGGIYLIWRGTIRVRIPAAFLGTVAALTFLFPKNGVGNVEWMAAQLCSGGLMLGAFFMATDYVTSPVTKKGELYFGVGCGLLTVLIRYFGGYPEGVSYAILIMNVCVWLLDKAGKPGRFGVTAEAKKAAREARKRAKKEAA
ncbi:RnfABCDGE type electron transport complex subunit D [Pseudoflavonifractor sp. 524-17]|uniref:RnfABCDGE type electron transport complex subunit D n=1 Tax=Pseudoflavonifractor sp. 524-17 TaxID=2304577 RepID=UPI00137B35F1|nr:RnfABCDGE type electron transport complex subunit D [Pseudoflavonifractor sp. 524-17]NCE65967.1 RnfABCDGE type electron transport complex subunit D [Pseudoflavonifractor sp. 524-17]